MTIEELRNLENPVGVLALSYGKDSIRTLMAIKKLNLPLHRIIHREIWRTDDIPADLPPMVAFKDKVDRWILENFGIRVERVCAVDRQCISGGGTAHLRKTILQNTCQ